VDTEYRALALFHIAMQDVTNEVMRMAEMLEPYTKTVTSDLTPGPDMIDGLMISAERVQMRLQIAHSQALAAR
jgi:hypothetical protein